MIAVILAAGMSSRFGRCKQTFKLDGKPILRHVLDSLRFLVETNIVVGHYEEDVRSISERFVSRVIQNQYYKDGIGSSIQLAVDYALDRKEDLLLTLGDLAFVNRDDYKKLMMSYEGRH